MSSANWGKRLHEFFRRVFARPEAIALAITFAYFAVAIAFGEFRYRINDDTGIAGSIREGFYVRYVGALLTHIVSTLTELFDTRIDWYAVILLLANIFSVFLVVSAIRRLCRSPWSFALLAGIVLALFVSYLFALSFTFSAILLGCSSIAYIYAISQEGDRIPYGLALMAGFAMALAVTIRIQGGEGAVVMGSGLLLVLLVRSQLVGRDESFKRLLRLGVAFAAFPLLLVGTDYLLKLNASPEYHAYEIYDAERGKIHGKARMYRYVNDEKFLKEVGWEVRHAHQFKNWMFFDEDRFGLSHVRRYNELADARMADQMVNEYLSIGGLADRVSRIFSPNLQLIYIALLLLFLLIVFSRKRLEVTIESATMVFLPFMALLYLALFSKVPSRVTGPLLTGWLFIFIVYFSGVLPGIWQSRGKRVTVTVLLSTLFVILCYKEFSPLPGQMERTRNRQALIEAQMDKLNQQAQGKILVAQPGRGFHEFTRNPFQLLDRRFHQVKLGWKTFSPDFYSQIERVGAESGSEFMTRIALCEDVRILSSIGWAKVLAGYISEKTEMRVSISRTGGLNKSVGLFSLSAVGHRKMNCQELAAENAQADER